KRLGMLDDGDGIIVAVSGGPDSVTLLHVLYELSRRCNYRLHVAHLNHKLRGDDADADATFVEQLAQTFGLPCTVKVVDVRAVAKERKMSIEQAGRAMRYEFLRELASEYNYRRIALGHTADDVLETVILNLFRGTGLDGLLGIPPVSDDIFIRPLILCRRAETHLYCKVRRLPTRIDVTNFDTRIRRNWVRLELLPQVREHISLKADTAVLRLVELLRADSALLHELTERAWKDVVIQITDTNVWLDRERFLQLPLAIQRRIIRKAWQRMQGETFVLTMEHIDRAIDLIHRHKHDAMLTMPEQFTLELANGKIYLGKRHEPSDI
ncbi:MAG TPA: tRNA lysidine(34) synthetase TilS, partial [Armatimonadetes bacterium]|nr:tRNA lysidine(34) synthetase TilS [Armatimonadota bacterium]